MITLLEPMDGKKPTYYIINNYSPATFNTTYSDNDDFDEAVIIDKILYGKDNIKSGEIEDLKNYQLVNELDVCGGESKADNTNKILRRL